MSLAGRIKGSDLRVEGFDEFEEFEEFAILIVVVCLYVIGGVL